MCDLIPNYSYAYGNLPKTAQKLHLESLTQKTPPAVRRQCTHHARVPEGVERLAIALAPPRVSQASRRVFWRRRHARQKEENVGRVRRDVFPLTVSPLSQR